MCGRTRLCDRCAADGAGIGKAFHFAELAALVRVLIE
jgi:hypothetical protein